MIVRFYYNTKLNAQNRCYDGKAYNEYLKSLVNDYYYHDYTFKDNVLPNVPFYVPRKQTDTITGEVLDFFWEGYNYITYELGGIKYGAFITYIKPISPEGTLEIHQRVDYWYYLTQNYVIYGSDGVNHYKFDIHGDCLRAHVNDWEIVWDESSGTKKAKAIKPIMKNTYIKPEEEVVTNAYDTNESKLTGKKSAYKYLYMVINNPKQTGFTYPDGFAQTLRYYWKGFGSTDQDLEQVPCPNLICCGIVDGKGNVSFRCSTSDLTDDEEKTYADYEISLADIQSDTVNGLAVSDIPPNRKFTVGEYYVSTTKHYYFKYSNSEDFSEVQFEALGSTKKWLPKKIDCPSVLEDEHGSVEVNAYNYNFMLSISKDLKSYEVYFYNGITKLHTAPYVTTYINGNFVDYFYNDKNATEEISTSGQSATYSIYYRRFMLPTLASVATCVTGLTYCNERANYWLQNNLCKFVPLVTRSVIDNIDLSIAGVSSERKIKNAQFNMVRTGVEATANAVTSVLSFANPNANLVGAATNVVNSTISGAFNGAQAGMDLKYDTKEANLSLQKAEAQYKNGNVYSDSATGYYSYIAKQDFNNFTVVRPKEWTFDQLGKLLNRYGYNTPLMVDEVYKNHRRAYFNYFLTKNCDIEGVPQYIAQEVEQMFDSGVFLWTSSDINNFDVPNWQRDIHKLIGA